MRMVVKIGGILIIFYIYIYWVQRTNFIKVERKANFIKVEYYTFLNILDLMTSPAAASAAAPAPASASSSAAPGTPAAEQGIRMKLLLNAIPTHETRRGPRLDVFPKSKPPTGVSTTPVKGSLSKLSPTTRYDPTLSPGASNSSPVAHDSLLRMRMLKQNRSRVSLVQIPAKLFPCPTSNLSPEAQRKVSELVKLVGSGRKY
jgi:hypothetical protein